MSKYTPGPWFAELQSSHCYSREDRPKWVVLHKNDDPAIWAEEVADVGEQSKETEANARLIAAAPELLEALEASETKWRVMADNMGGNRYCLANADECRAAITKATAP